MHTFPYPYPPVLTRQDWDHKKGVIAKMHGPTGIGAQCDVVYRAHGHVDWDKLNALKRMKAIPWGRENFNTQTWEHLLGEARAEVNGSLATLVRECEELHRLCVETGKKFKESRKIPASSTKHVVAVGNAAAKMAADLSAKGMAEDFNEQNAALRAQTTGIIMDSINGFDAVMTRHKDVIENLRRTPTVANFNKLTGTAARDYDALVGNLIVAAKKGFMRKLAGAKTVHEQLHPYGSGTRSGYLQGQHDANQVNDEIDEFERVLAMARKFAKSAKAMVD